MPLCCRYKAQEIEAMSSKVPLSELKAAIKNAAPVRDFKGAILRRAKETGATGSHQL